MRLRRLALLALVAMLLPLATAGSERRPDIRDPQGDGRDAATDILAAWLEPDDTGLRFTIQMARATRPSDYTDHIYWILFTLDETGRQVSAAVGYGPDGVLRGHLASGPNTGGLDGRDSTLNAGSFDRVANDELLDLAAILDAPATFSGTIPWGAYDELTPGALLAEWMVGNTRFEPGRGWTGAADRASADGPFVADIPRAGVFSDVFPILVPAWVLPTVVITTTALGLAGGWALAAATARRAPHAPPAARAVPVETAPRAPGERFAREPPARR